MHFLSSLTILIIVLSTLEAVLGESHLAMHLITYQIFNSIISDTTNKLALVIILHR